LAIPSLVIGALTIQPMLYGGWFDGAIVRTETMEEMTREFHGWWPMVLHAFTSLPLYLALAGDFWRSEGLDIRHVVSPSTARTATALLDGKVDVSWGGPMRVMMHHDADPRCPLVCFGQVVARDLYNNPAIDLRNPRPDAMQNDDVEHWKIIACRQFFKRGIQHADIRARSRRQIHGVGGLRGIEIRPPVFARHSCGMDIERHALPIAQFQVAQRPAHAVALKF
jgi:hypothetical protein